MNERITNASTITTYSYQNGIISTSGTHKVGRSYNIPGVPTEYPMNYTRDMTGIDSIAIPVTNFRVPINGYISYSGEEVWYKFTADVPEAHPNADSGSYMFYSLTSDVIVSAALYDTAGHVIVSESPTGTGGFSLGANLPCGTVFYLCMSGYSTGYFNFQIDYLTAEYYTDRMYLSFGLGSLPRNPIIKKAELTVYQADGHKGYYSSYPKIGLYHVNSEIITGNNTPLDNGVLIDYAVIKNGQYENGEIISYTFDITSLVDKIANSYQEYIYPNLVLKALDESNSLQRHFTLYGSLNESYSPEITITYESTYGTNVSHHAHTHDLGRFGRGIVDLKQGNLIFDSNDFAWDGKRMPITLKHLYNSALFDQQYTHNTDIKFYTADFSNMKIGNGFKLNIMQSITTGEFPNGLTSFIYIDEDGNETFFEMSDTTVTPEDDGQPYYLYRDTGGLGMLYDMEKKELTRGDETYSFDTAGRLIKITDKYGNHMDITYTNGKITAATDGSGRVFTFTYTEDFLTSITAPDGTSISYTYSNDKLTEIVYPGDRKAVIDYGSTGRPTRVTLYELSDSDTNTWNAVYKTEYFFNGYTLEYLDEYSDALTRNAEVIYDYNHAANRTVVESRELKRSEEIENEYITENIVKTVYVFNDEGHIISEYTYTDETGNIGTSSQSGTGIIPHAEKGMIQSSRNFLLNHSFDAAGSWIKIGTLSELDVAYQDRVSAPVMFGKRAACLTSKLEENTGKGIYQQISELSTGEYTFSAYLKPSSDTVKAYIRVTDSNGNVLSESEKISGIQEDYIRLAAPFELTSEQSIKVYILLDGQGTAYADGAQLEDKPYANEYNMLENGCFLTSSAWRRDSSVSYYSYVSFDSSGSLKIVGDLDSERKAYQNVYTNTDRSTRETFTLSGWAKGNPLSCGNHNGGQTPTFRLRATVIYDELDENGNDSESFTADFCPNSNEWQYTSVQFAKDTYRPVNSIAVYCEYSYNSGTAYFDDIQLVRNNIETGLTAEDFEPSSAEDNTTTEEDQTSESPFEEARDAYGNILTETVFDDTLNKTIYRSFGYNGDYSGTETINDAGNDLIRETDPRGNSTGYSYDITTSHIREMTDRIGNNTEYQYDTSGRVTKVTSMSGNAAELSNVSYSYDSFDNMTEITRGDGMKYALSYNSYHNLESVGIDGKQEKLVTYTYNNGSGRLKEVTYANGDVMKLTYNSIGQLTSEMWYTHLGAMKGYCKYVYDGHGNIVRSIDFFDNREYNYIYENDVLVRATEYDITFDSFTYAITSRSVVNTIFYVYSNGTLTKKRIVTSGGEEHVITYNTADGTTSITDNLGFTASSSTDALGRKVSDSVTAQSPGLSRQFEYHNGAVTAAHRENNKVKYDATTRLVSKITLTGGRTLEYTYDKEERITKVVDTSGTTVTTTEYTYDALGQLKKETVNGEVINTMSYDNYGNIVSKNGKTYTYDAVWKDRLLSYDGTTLAYDAQGNPTTYFGNTLTWEKGRQLKQFGTTSYSYNANGIRTSKSIDGIVHRYCLEGTKILRETWTNNVLIPLYDNEDSICGIKLNQTCYLFVKNLQGDIISIADEYGAILVKYRYDAWGKCTVVSDTSGFNLSAINPFRYRGYYFDTETNLYYLQSRYYDPELGRFLNADMIDILTISFRKNTPISFNLFTYCNNNPQNSVDYIGFEALTLAAVSSIVITALCFGIVVYSLYKLIKELIEFIRLVLQGICDLLGYLKNVIKEAVETAIHAIKYPTYEVHHIVARTDRRAFASKQLLNENGIELEDSCNKVSINTTLHRHLHSNSYHAAVYLALLFNSFGYDKPIKRTRIISTLEEIKAILKSASLLLEF